MLAAITDEPLTLLIWLVVVIIVVGLVVWALRQLGILR